MSFHHESTGANNHVIHAFTYADETSRLAASGFLAGDVGKVALQSDTASFYVLTVADPVTWVLMAYSGPAGVSGAFEVLDPTTGATKTVSVLSGLITGIS